MKSQVTPTLILNTTYRLHQWLQPENLTVCMSYEDFTRSASRNISIRQVRIVDAGPAEG